VLCGADPLRDLYRLDVSKRVWTSLDGMVIGNLTPSARSSHGLAALGQSLYLFGGYSGSGE